jgi:hypothetical protein
VSWIKPSALDQARGHVNRIAARLASVGIGSSTLKRLQADLATSFSVNPKTGWLVIPDEQATRLQTAASDLETVLRNGHALHLGDYDLPQLRYLLSTEIVG